MRDWSFDPAQQAFTLESTAAIPDGGSGSVELISENPQFMSLTAKMDSAGLVVIGDRYDSGWQATVDGQPAELLCVNHVPGAAMRLNCTTSLRHLFWEYAFFFAAVILLLMLVWSCRHSFQALRARM